MADEATKDECKICDIVLIGVGLAVAGVLAFMAIDLATSGKLSGVFSKPLATVLPFTTEEGTAGDSDAG